MLMKDQTLKTEQIMCEQSNASIIYFWQGSRWTLQATRMNGRLGKFTLQPDQMQALNPVLILVFIPIFETVVYPVFGKFHLLKR